MWDVIENGYESLVQSDGTTVPRSRWNKEQKKAYQLNQKARDYLICAITPEEYENVESVLLLKECGRNQS